VCDLVIPCYIFSMMSARDSYIRYFMVVAYLFQAVKMLSTIFSGGEKKVICLSWDQKCL